MLDPLAVRRTILAMAKAGDCGHIGCAFSLVEILLAVKAQMRDGDELILSKGHGAMAKYAIEGCDPLTYLKDGTELRSATTPGGALGHGLSIGVGVALAQKRDPTLGRPTLPRTFVVVGDGELNEGACWEAMATASQWKLGNLFMLVDRNGYQAMGATQDVVDLSPLKKKIEAFGWLALKVCDGNSVEAITGAFHRLHDYSVGADRQRPKALICNTTKGFGVSFMAGNNDWHGNKLDQASYDAAMAELNRPEAAVGAM